MGKLNSNELKYYLEKRDSINYKPKKRSSSIYKKSNKKQNES